MSKNISKGLTYLDTVFFDSVLGFLFQEVSLITVSPTLWLKDIRTDTGSVVSFSA